MTTAVRRAARAPGPPGRRAAALDWPRIAADLDAHGCATVSALLEPEECAALAGAYAGDEGFRSRVVMAQHGFGRGEYRYFAYPLPDVIAELRTALYPSLATIANRWNESWAPPSASRRTTPPSSSAAIGPARPGRRRSCSGTAWATTTACTRTSTGSTCFPLQVTVLLSVPGRDFTGGEFVLVEQRPRRQSRVEVVALAQGDAVIFPVRTGPCRERGAPIASISATA